MYMYRKLRSEDLELLCTHRERMFLEAGHEPEAVTEMTMHVRPWLESRLKEGRYFGTIVESNGIPVASIGLMVIDWPPHPLHPQVAFRGYVLGLFVEPDHRDEGLARALMQQADVEFAARGIDFCVLHTTKAGRPLYEKLGWSPTNEMSKRVRSARTRP